MTEPHRHALHRIDTQYIPAGFSEGRDHVPSIPTPPLAPVPDAYMSSSLIDIRSYNREAPATKAKPSLHIIGSGLCAVITGSFLRTNAPILTFMHKCGPWSPTWLYTTATCLQLPSTIQHREYHRQSINVSDTTRAISHEFCFWIPAPSTAIILGCLAHSHTTG